MRTGLCSSIGSCPPRTPTMRCFGWCARCGPTSSGSSWHTRQGARRLRQFIAALTVLLVVAIGASLYGFSQQRFAVHQRDVATSRQVADETNSISRSDLTLAMQLSVTAYRIAPTSEARSSLLSASAFHTATRVLGDYGTIFAVAISSDNRTLAAGSADGSVLLFDISNAKAPTFLSVLTDHIGGVYTVVFSPDGRTLASGGEDHTVRLWDLTDPRHSVPLATLAGRTNAVNAVVFSPDGHALASGSDDSTAQLWDTDPEEAAKNI